MAELARLSMNQVTLLEQCDMPQFLEVLAKNDVRRASLWREKTRAHGVELIGEIFNLFNSKNAANFNGNCAVNAAGQCTFTGGFGQANTFAGDPAQGEQRLAQLGIRVTF